MIIIVLIIKIITSIIIIIITSNKIILLVYFLCFAKTILFPEMLRKTRFNKKKRFRALRILTYPSECFIDKKKPLLCVTKNDMSFNRRAVYWMLYQGKLLTTSVPVVDFMYTYMRDSFAGETFTQDWVAFRINLAKAGEEVKVTSLMEVKELEVDVSYKYDMASEEDIEGTEDSEMFFHLVSFLRLTEAIDEKISLLGSDGRENR